MVLVSQIQHSTSVVDSLIDSNLDKSINEKDGWRNPTIFFVVIFSIIANMDTIIFKEARKCKSDIVHFTQTYVVDFKLDENQMAYLKNLASGNDSTYEVVDNVHELSLAFALWKMLVCPCTLVVFMSKGKSERNLLANRFREMISRIKLFEVKLTRDLKHEISLSDNSTIFFGDYESYECQLCGRTICVLILDDFKSFENKAEFMQYVFPVVRAYRNGQIIQS